MKNWSLTQPVLLTRTATSAVYRVVAGEEPAVLKIFTPLGAEDERGGAEALRRFGGRGAVELLRHDAGAQLLEYAEGADLTGLVAAGRDGEAAEIIARVLNDLHAAPAGDASAFTPLRERFRSLFKKAGRDRAAGAATIFTKAAGVVEDLLREPRGERLLHGDMHHENVRFSPARGCWLAIDPKGVWGERAYDAANVLCNPMDMPEIVHSRARLLAQADILARVMAVPRERLLAFTFAHACLSACWSEEDGEDPSYALKAAALAEPLLP